MSEFRPERPERRQIRSLRCRLGFHKLMVVGSAGMWFDRVVCLRCGMKGRQP